MDLGPPVGTILERAHLHPDWKNHIDNIRESQSHYLIIPSLSNPGSTSTGSSRQLLTPK
jgi:hypothetical protein